jgi:cytochrome c oxidase subunit III
MSDHLSNPAVREQFEDAAQQHEAATLGTWTFLATEILFFGGLFMAYVAYRHAYSEAFAEGSRHVDLVFGTLNTAILLTSSLTMALAVQAARLSQIQSLVRCLGLTFLFAMSFVVVKGFEYHEDIVEHLVPGPFFSRALPPQAEIFFFLYWAMTGLHALHVLVGMGLLGTLFFLARAGRYSSDYYTPVEMIGLYWHFVDAIWIFLYPLLYLIDRHA